MKSKLLFFIFILLIPVPFYGQRDHTQELIDLLNEGRCFDAMNYREQYHDSIPDDPFFTLFYQYHMAWFFNKPDSAARYLSEMVRQENEAVWGLNVGRFRGELLKIYDTSQQYEKAIELCDSTMDYLIRNPFDMPEDLREKDIEFVRNVQSAIAEKAKILPRMRVVREEIYSKIPLCPVDTGLIHFEAEYNGKPTKTLFDTGLTHYFFLEKSLAGTLGVKIYDLQQDSIELVNGSPVRAITGIFDSIRIGPVCLYNIPALIFLDKFTVNISDSLLSNPDIKTQLEPAFDSMQIFMGLAAMKLIGRFELDQDKNTMTIPPIPSTDTVQMSHNIFFDKNNLYVNLKINDQDCNLVFDTGMQNTFLSLNDRFYEKNKQYICLDKETPKEPIYTATFSGECPTLDYEMVKDADIVLNDKTIPSRTNEVLIKPDVFTHLETFDGSAGSLFFRRPGQKIILDLVNMRVEGK